MAVRSVCRDAAVRIRFGWIYLKNLKPNILLQLSPHSFSGRKTATSFLPADIRLKMPSYAGIIT
jgi:hypothetical protein